MTIENNFLRNTNLGLLLLRLTIGGLMLFHGVHKAIHGVSFIEGMLEGIGLPGWIAYGAILGELVSSLMIIFGVWTRVAAVIFSGTMVVAILMAHTSQLCSIDPMTGGWVPELPALFLMGGIVLFFTGGGKYAITKGCVTD